MPRSSWIHVAVAVVLLAPVSRADLISQRPHGGMITGGPSRVSGAAPGTATGDLSSLLWEFFARYPAPGQLISGGGLLATVLNLDELSIRTDTPDESALISGDKLRLSEHAGRRLPGRLRSFRAERIVVSPAVEPTAAAASQAPARSGGSRPQAPATPPAFLEEDPWIDRAPTPIRAAILFCMLTFLAVLWIRRESRVQ